MKDLSDKVNEYNKLNKHHDYTYMYSDDGRAYRKGSAQANELSNLYMQLSPEEKDIVALYNNFVLKRSEGQFKKTTLALPNTLEEAKKYFDIKE